MFTNSPNLNVPVRNRHLSSVTHEPARGLENNHIKSICRRALYTLKKYLETLMADNVESG